MVNVQQLRAYKYAEPFKPFQLVLADGRRVTVPRPENIGWSPETRTVVFPAGRDALDWTDFNNVVELRVAPKCAAAAKKRRKAS